ncbi:MAG: DUF4412 domain-containing protein [Proteobacteria bacterium]|nr:DUF4412 domain-containing protein [Pseudomonadota bacterium]
MSRSLLATATKALLAISALPAISFALASPLLGGVVFELEVTDHSGSTPQVERMQISVEGRSFMMEALPASDGRSAAAAGHMIFHGDRREMVVIDHNNKAYMVMTSELFENVGTQMQRQLEKALENVSEERRALIEKMMKGRLGQPLSAPQRPSTDYRKTSERATKQGYPCVRWDAFRDGEKTLEMWVTNWSNISGGSEVMDAFAEMAAFAAELMASVEKMAGGLGGASFLSTNNSFEAFARVDGFPVLTRRFDHGDLKNETILRSASRKSLDRAVFEPPADYKRRSLPTP